MEKIKHLDNLEWLEKMNAENAQYLQFLQNDVISRLSNGLVNQLEDLLIQGLKNKGFEFNNKIELENFIKTRCRKEDYIEKKEHIYYVDNIPFFLHNYEIIYEPITEDNNGIKMTANYGKYAFL
jgi:hypothetical protein